jgi:hypothetical protein
MMRSHHIRLRRSQAVPPARRPLRRRLRLAPLVLVAVFAVTAAEAKGCTKAAHGGDMGCTADFNDRGRSHPRLDAGRVRGWVQSACTDETVKIDSESLSYQLYRDGRWETQWRQSNPRPGRALAGTVKCVPGTWRLLWNIEGYDRKGQARFNSEDSPEVAIHRC